MCDDKKKNAMKVADAARKAEHRCLAALSTHAGNTTSLEITRATPTNTPDGGHDLGVTGTTEEIKSLVSDLTGHSVDSLNFLDQSAKKGKLKVRIDVKNVKTVSGDIIDKHASDSNRSPDCQVNLIVMTNQEGKVTPDAQKKLQRHKENFKEVNTLCDIALPNGIAKIEEQNKGADETN
ncbi:hypothetical protein K0I63_05790 [Shewanella rhizosphaerae]|uniref:hypothetical protein n=1 Tax=Shewanella rhizosphaerae TaxID=2864207 RepID=UPI001C657EF2|nr:hypothetical protein [Shewanella rhizosphaerae]QYK14027.1 hypothetical protein K0I63_05790 [Shewanella rhizosphaerae]